MHLIQFEMLVNKQNKDIVHHYDVLECDDEYNSTEKVAEECYVNMSDYVMEKCRLKGLTFIAWSIGGQYVCKYQLLDYNQLGLQLF